jgi:UPF0755 protein
MKRPLLLALVLILLALAGAAAVIASWIYRPYKGYEAAEQFVEIPTGTGVAAIGRRLADAGVVRDPTAFRFAVRLADAGSLKAGDYRFDQPMSAIEVAEKLARGDVYLRTITFREGLTIREMAEIFEREGFGSKDAFLQAASRGELIHTLDPAASDLEGYLFPDTYAVPRRATAEAVVDMMVARFRREFESTLPARAESIGRTVREVITLASLVEKETGKPEERRIVSGVYTNRLRIGMGLQCDPTVLYALHRDGFDVRNLTRENLRYDSPYNTYRYAGLPPGPIAAPGRASVDAAIDPADVPYFYFVSRNDGSHVFATTLQEHNKNVHEWQILYWREQRRKAAEEGGTP